jgi:hypothetical protein
VTEGDDHDADLLCQMPNLDWDVAERHLCVVRGAARAVLKIML